jgi:hypothetical protein
MNNKSNVEPEQNEKSEKNEKKKDLPKKIMIVKTGIKAGPIMYDNLKRCSIVWCTVRTRGRRAGRTTV